MTQALLERELRRALEQKGGNAIRLYPERRPCHRPTARRLIDLFENIQRHTLHTRGQAPVTMVTALSRVQRQKLGLPGLPATQYAGTVLYCFPARTIQRSGTEEFSIQVEPHDVPVVRAGDMIPPIRLRRDVPL